MAKINWRHRKLAKQLVLAKLKYGDVIPLTTNVDEIKDNLTLYNAVAEAAAKGYLRYGHEIVEDDEGLRHVFQRGYRFTAKGLALLEEVAK